MAGKKSKKEKRRQRRYRVAVEGFRSVLHILILVLVVLLIAAAGRRAYRFGYDVFYEVSAEEAPGRDVTVTIPEYPTASEIGHILKDAGLIEDVWVFVVQERLSAYHDKIKPGTYTLNTSQKPTEMLSVLGAEEEDDAS